MRHFFWLTLLLVAGPARADSLELKDGDRVVLLGGTLIEREQRSGWWELALTLRWPDRQVTFRNLGWSGDTVGGEARAVFGTPADGFRKLRDHVLSLKPTVIILHYGTVEAFAGAPGLERFIQGYEALLRALAPTKARLVLLPPIYHENLGRPLPDPTTHNQKVTLYANAVAALAEKLGHFFAPLHEHLARIAGKEPLTDNGMHPTEDGYRRAIPALEAALGWKPSGLEASKMDEKSPLELLHQTIMAKNQLYFHRWRPQNETYLFGFRKHEQGQNAREIPQFDPLVEAREKEIARLRTQVKGTKENGR